jgi:sarcosine oxidase
VRADVIVVGLGSMGATAAYELASRGLRVIGLDRFHPPHDRGAHGGGSRIIRTAYMEGAEYVPLVRRSWELWRHHEVASGDSVLTPTGGLMLGPPGSAPVAGALAAARAHGLAHEFLDADEIRGRFPAIAPGDEDMGLFEANAGLLRPDVAIAGYLRLARAAGADLRTGVRVEDWRADPAGAGVTVRTAAGILHAERLVLAPGAWAPALTRLGVQLRVERRVQHYWRGGGLFGPGRLPVWIWAYGDGLVAYGLPSLDGAVKAAQHHGDEPADPDAGAAAVRADEIAAMRAWLSRRLPGLGDWLGSKPCLYTLTPDGHFVLGPHPEHPNVAVACGFSGHGFKFAPVVGQILADLAEHGKTRHPIQLFDPGRFDGAATARGGQA